MNTNEKREAISDRVAEIIPDATLNELAQLYTGDGRIEYFVQITALDILRALGVVYGNNKVGIDAAGIVTKIATYEQRHTGHTQITVDLSQTLDQWDEPTINKLYELFYE